MAAPDFSKMTADEADKFVKNNYSPETKIGWYSFDSEMNYGSYQYSSKQGPVKVTHVSLAKRGKPLNIDNTDDLRCVGIVDTYIKPIYKGKLTWTS